VPISPPQKKFHHFQKLIYLQQVQYCNLGADTGCHRKTLLNGTHGDLTVKQFRLLAIGKAYNLKIRLHKNKQV